jgi:hypothetical protein
MHFLGPYLPYAYLLANGITKALGVLVPTAMQTGTNGSISLGSTRMGHGQSSNLVHLKSLVLVWVPIGTKEVVARRGAASPESL